MNAPLISAAPEPRRRKSPEALGGQPPVNSSLLRRSPEGLPHCRAFGAEPSRRHLTPAGVTQPGRCQQNIGTNGQDFQLDAAYEPAARGPGGRTRIPHAYYVSNPQHRHVEALLLGHRLLRKLTVQ